jgi:hypothetical protein
MACGDLDCMLCDRLLCVTLVSSFLNLGAGASAQLHVLDADYAGLGDFAS